MEIIALVVSGLAFIVSVYAARTSARLSRHSNSLPVLIDLFSEHRGLRLAEARTFVQHELSHMEIKNLNELPEEQFTLVRDLCWFYDNLGALVTHDVVDIGPVSGYLGGSVLSSWKVLEPLIKHERARRNETEDPKSWQVYFENLAVVLGKYPPQKARSKARNWRLRPSS